MSVQISNAMNRGARRVVSTSGIVVAALALAYQFLFTGSVNTVLRAALPGSGGSETAPGLLTLPVSPTVAGPLAVVAVLVGIGTSLVGARLFARPTAELSSVPSAAFTRRALPAFLSIALVSLVVGVLVAVGFVVFVVPGLFLAVSLQFAIFVVAVEDAGPVAALSRSWSLASGNRWPLFGLLLVVGIVSTAATVGGSLFSVALVGSTGAQVVSLALNTLVLVFTYGVIADAYLQVRNDTPGTGGRQAATSGVEPL